MDERCAILADGRPSLNLVTTTAAHIQIKEGFKSQHLEVLRGTLDPQDLQENRAQG
jgi:hypothetical protein